MRYVFGFILAYVIVAPLTPLISYDLRETEWTNILTYLWLIGGYVTFFLSILIGMIIAGARLTHRR